MTPEQYAKEITKGFWLAPKRKREIEREILEHLEDLSEDKHHEPASKQELEQTFGPIKKLRNLFNKGGLPMWARFLKWGIIGFGILLGLFVILDLCVLWFYSIDPEMIRAYKANQTYFDQFDISNRYALYKMKIDWLDPNEENEVQTWEKFKNAIAALDVYYQAEGNADMEFNSRPEIAEKIKNATPVPMPGTMQVGGGFVGFGMGPNTVDLMSEDEKKEYEKYKREQTQDAFNKLCQAWLAIEATDRLRFPKPEVTDKDIELLQSVKHLTTQELMQKSMNPQNNLHMQSANSWLQTAHAYANLPSKHSDREIIQSAKELHSRMPFQMKLQDIIGKIRDRMKSSENKEEAAKLAETSFRWCRKYMEAADPNPEPLIDLLVVTAASQTAFYMLTDHVQSLEDIDTFQAALQVFTQIPFGKVLDNWPVIPNSIQHNWGMTDSIATSFGMFSLFKAQCGFMQHFYDENTDGWYHYELMKKGVMLVLFQIALPNLENARQRAAVVKAKQDMAQLVLNLKDRSPEEAQNYLADFQRDDLQVELEDSAFEIHAPGPNQIFDAGIYAPSNGITSKGDLVWEMKFSK